MSKHNKLTDAQRKFIRQEEKELTSILKGYMPEAINLLFEQGQVET